MAAFEDCFVDRLTGSDTPSRTVARVGFEAPTFRFFRIDSIAGNERVTRLIMPVNSARVGYEILHSGSGVTWVYSFGTSSPVDECVQFTGPGNFFRSINRDAMFTGPIYACPLGTQLLSGSALLIAEYSLV